MQNELLCNLDKLHTTELGIARVKRNLGLDAEDVVVYCRQIIETADNTTRKGKNWYAYCGDIVIAINAHSYTIITAHKEKL